MFVVSEKEKQSVDFSHAPIILPALPPNEPDHQIGSGAVPNSPLMKTFIGKLFLLLALLSWPTAFFAQGSGPLLTTFTNPTPAAFHLFGSTVAGMGNDRVLIAAGGAGAVYLFSPSTALLTTFTNPTPAGGAFGSAVTAVGNDWVLIGDYADNTGAIQTGAAFLFSSNGTVLTTFTNPTPAAFDAFGWAVAAVGTDRVIISALSDSAAAPNNGAAYLFRTNGTLLTTFNNPTPANGDGFGNSVAALGTDRVLIGASADDVGAANSGAAYLFRTNGALLTTFTNPTPAASDEFGISVAAVGTDRVLIGANRGHSTVSGAGAAYLFTTNGTLLTTFVSPTAQANDSFGYSVAALGSSQVLIGAYGNSTGANQAGAAFLFSTDGTLLNTLTNPTPANQDWFAVSVAALGSDGMIIGGVWDDTGATDSGSAYLFDLPYPTLSITRSAATVSLKWITPETGLALQQAGALSASTGWSNTSDAVSINGQTNSVQQTMVITNRFYRLRRP